MTEVYRQNIDIKQKSPENFEALKCKVKFPVEQVIMYFKIVLLSVIDKFYVENKSFKRAFWKLEYMVEVDL